MCYKWYHNAPGTEEVMIIESPTENRILFPNRLAVVVGLDCFALLVLTIVIELGKKAAKSGEVFNVCQHTRFFISGLVIFKQCRSYYIISALKSKSQKFQLLALSFWFWLKRSPPTLHIYWLPHLTLGQVDVSIQYCYLYCHPESENTPGLRSDREAEWAKSDHLVGLLPPATELDDQFFWHFHDCWFLCQPLLLNLKKRHFITSILILLFCVLQPNLPVLFRINVKTMSF